METAQTYSNLFISQPGHPSLKTSAMVVLLAINPSEMPVKAAASAVPSSQLHAWEQQLPGQRSALPTTEPDYRDSSDLYMKPAAVRRYTVKGRVRSIRKGSIR